MYPQYIASGIRDVQVQGSDQSGGGTCRVWSVRSGSYDKEEERKHQEMYLFVIHASCRDGSVSNGYCYPVDHALVRKKAQGNDPA